jgi:MoaA/NifB/PqqE/SkfB family radical SAM enzyme
MFKLIKEGIFSALSLRLQKAAGFFIEPRFINFITTYRCNSACNSCNIWDRYRQDKEKIREEVTFSDIKNFFLHNKRYFSRLLSIGLTGGEFTLRSDALEIVNFFHEHFPFAKLGFQTNGLDPEGTKKLLSQILRIDADFNIAVSLDGPGEVHDRVRGIRGAFEKSIQTIRYAKELGIKRITSGMTITNENFHYILDVEEICEELETEFSCFLAERGDYFNNETRIFPLNDSQKKVVSNSLRHFQYDYYMDNLKLQLEGKRKICLPCYSGYTSLVIDPYGNIKPCILKDNSFGNIKTDLDFRELMLSQEAERLKSGLRKCVCWCQCEVSASAFVDPLDVIWWLVFYCQDKKGFLAKIKKRWSR